MHGVKSRGNQAQAYKSPLPVESHQVSLIPSSISCDNMYIVLSKREALLNLVFQEFYWELVT